MPTSRSSERAPLGTTSGDSDAAGGWHPSLTFTFGTPSMGAHTPGDGWDTLRFTRRASIVGCVSLLVALSETSNKGIGPVGTAAWFVVVMAGALGIVGYSLCKQDGIRVSIAYLIIPILLMAAFAELVFFRDIVAALASHPVGAQQSASVNAGVTHSLYFHAWGPASLS
jgi:hypothetical protein